MPLDAALQRSKRYSLRLQKQIQCACCIVLSLLCASMIYVDEHIKEFKVTEFKEEAWNTATFAMSVVGIVVSVFAIVGVYFHVRFFLLIYLVYILLFLTYRVIYTVFGFSKEDLHRTFFYLQVTITSAVVLLDWIQTFYALYYYRLLRFYDAYHEHPGGQQEQVPVSDLVMIFEALGQKPTQSQVVELLSYLPPGESTISFEDFTQMGCEYYRMRSRAKLRRREHNKKAKTSPAGTREPLLGNGSGLRESQQRESQSIISHQSVTDDEDGGLRFFGGSEQQQDAPLYFPPLGESPDAYRRPQPPPPPPPASPPDQGTVP